MTKGVPLPLQPCFEAWEQMNRDYASVVKNDVPYWCGERTCVALLAAAAWRVGGMGITEYDQQSGHGPRPCRRRIDAWLRSKAGEEYLVEAKHTFVDGGTNAGELRDLLAEAARQVQTATRHNAEQRLALVFAVAKLLPREKFTDLQNLAQPTEDAFCFKATAARPVPTDRGYSFPGVLVLGRLVAD